MEVGKLAGKWSQKELGRKPRRNEAAGLREIHMLAHFSMCNFPLSAFRSWEGERCSVLASDRNTEWESKRWRCYLIIF